MKNTEIPEELWEFLPYVNADQALDATRAFLNRDYLEITHDLAGDFSLAEIWDPEWSRADGRKAHAWFFVRNWVSCRDRLTPEERGCLVDTVRQGLGLWFDCSTATNSMAYHDETTAQRVMNWAVFLYTYADDVDEKLTAELVQAIRQHADLLATSEFYAGLNNHGMFQDISLLVASGLGFLEKEKCIEFEDVAFTRLETYFSTCFTADGIHTENSPSYHLMVSRYLKQVLDYGEVVGQMERFSHLREIATKADMYAAFALSPSGSFVPVSDTSSRPVGEATARNSFGDGHFVGVVSRGKRGLLPAAKTFVAEDSGYAVYRSGWTDSADNYLFFSAAYNANYHKHSDEMSLFYRAGGHDIIVEAGPNGYEYQDPLTKYAFSSWAHNSLVVDGQSLPRVDDKAELTTLEDNASTDTSLDVTGMTRRFEGVTWSRRLQLDGATKGREVTVTDRVDSVGKRAYTFIWHFGPDIDALVRGNVAELFHRDTRTKLAELSWSGAPVNGVRQINGQEYPRFQGWHFPRMGTAIPADALEVDVEGSSFEIFWTLRSSDFRLRDRGITPYSEWKTYQGEKPVNYLLDLPKDMKDGSCRQVAVVFSAISEKWDFTYNYRDSMKNYPGAVLYILDDFGDQGCYYLCNNQEPAEFRSVQALLQQVIQHLGLSTSEVITIGSSKGGTAAVIHGVTLGIRHVYAGAPQYHLGDFLEGTHDNVVKYMAGENSPAGVSWLNEVVGGLLAGGQSSTRITVVVGERDRHLQRHATPLINWADALGYPTELLKIPGTPHSELGSAFRTFVSTLCSEQRGQEFLLPNTATIDPENGTFGVGVSLPGGWGAVAQLYFGNEKVGQRARLIDGMAQWKITERGRYSARIYAEIPGVEQRRGFRSGSAYI
ncbi:hypothetical protein B841_09550 [Corynebacterium maris DSM 45190]|uniref:Uncharacterized protein n=1 Tax=Corynebacterium maris DSM 45190 TaxID=1224163 RepID=S5SWC0_9CORY|nr:heparinase II/III family protein [Corynebacterium maris]AGS35382.1 hypothetical protein B841_09550 [Corynebacterium maris DSM 45190]